MKVKGNHPLAEVIAKKLSGISIVPLSEQNKMVSRACMAAVKWYEGQGQKSAVEPLVMPGRACVDGTCRTTKSLLVQDLYNELLMAVESKHYNETRHETALRYIKEKELGSEVSCSGA